MLTLYYAPRSSALAAHIVLEEIDATYDSVLINTTDGGVTAPDYLRINPKGRVPALETPTGVVTESPAILTYLAETFPQASLMPSGIGDRARAHEINAYLCATVHVAFAHAKRGTRWAHSPEAVADLRAKAPHVLAQTVTLVEERYIEGPFVFGAQYSICDPYVFLAHRWLIQLGVDLAAFPRLVAHRDVMLARPATQRALAIHGL